MNGRTKAKKILTAITFLTVLAAMGCGTNSPVSPTQEYTTMPGIENPQFVRILPASTGSDRAMMGSSSTSVAQVVSAEDGGVVSNGYYNLYFPPGALDEDTEITLEMPLYPYAVVQLGPHGICFNKEVVMSLDVDMIDCDATEYRVLYHNEDAGMWEDIGGYMEDGAVKVGLEHFSEYGHERNISMGP
jgi:hypothetical protein